MLIAKLTFKQGLKFILTASVFVMSQNVWANVFRLQPEITNPSHIAGPNCWNQALMSVSLLDIPRFTSAEEFVYLVDAHCEQVLEPSLGSLGRMQDDQGDVHAFIYISESEVFAKNSMGAFERPGFMSFESMYQTYLIKDTEDCSAQQNAPHCLRQTLYYNCQNLKPEIQRQQYTLQDLNQTFHRIVYNFETMVRPRYTCDAEFLKQRFVLMQSLVTKIQDFKNQNQIFDLKYLQAWTISARLQIDEIEQSTYSERCMTLNSENLNNFQLFQTARDALATLLH
jgi:hypothetical protein